MSEQQQNRQAPARYSEPRIPYHPQFQEKFGISRMYWRLLVEQTFPAAKTAEGILLAVAYCKHRELDILKRPVHVVPIWDSQQGKEVESVWPGIGELRITAARTKLYAGKDKAEFGPDQTREFVGFTKKGEQKITVTFPAWCQVTVYKVVEGERYAFEGPKVYWEETYASMGKTDLPNSMWQKRPRGQLEKCAEAAALRSAFPEEIGNDYIPEEVGGQMMRDITPDRPRPEDYAAKEAEAAEAAEFPDSYEPDPEDPQQEEEPPAASDEGANLKRPDADDFPGDRPSKGEQKADKKANKTTAKKAAKPAEKQATEPEEPQPETAEDAPLVAGGPIDFLANWNKALKDCTTKAQVEALEERNDDRIRKFRDQELQNRIDEAAVLRKEALSQ